MKMRFLSVLARRLVIGALVTLFCLTATLSARASPVTQEDQAAITSPTQGQEIAGVLTITGSASHPDFERYELAYGPDPNPSDAWQPFSGNNQQVTNGVLGLWDTTTVADGTYTLRLRVVRHDSNYSEAFVHGLRVRNQQSTATPTPDVPPPTFAPEATLPPPATVVVEQPPTSLPVVASGANSGNPSGGAPAQRNTGSSTFDASLILSACLSGVLLSAGLFFVFGAIQAGRYGYKEFLRYQRRKSR